MKQQLSNILKVLPDFIEYKNIYFSALFRKIMCFIGFNKELNIKAKKRAVICKNCPLYDGLFCNINNCEGFYCGCGCFIGVKKYSDDSPCPTNRW